MACSCALCSRRWDRDHTAANVLLAQAQRVAEMSKAARDAHYVRVKAADGEQAAADLVAVVNAVRRTAKRGNE